ncbi:MAG: hypothetical protein AAFN81_24570 [Bacteroidota bacterium]
MNNGGHDLVAVLDWGLGHASRSVSLIEDLAAEGRKITIASSGKALLFLQKHFSTYPFVELPAYAIRYPHQSMVANMLWQLPRAIKVMREEHRQLQSVVQNSEITRIISDGRFGCWHPEVPSIWLAHQLQIQHANPGLASLANAGYHYYVRRRFQEVWIPDRAIEPRLAGKLSEPIVGLPYRYLGPQSRFQSREAQDKTMRFRYLALLSGPEPQRTRLETLLRTQLSKLNAPSLLVRGVPGATEIRKTSGQLHLVDWLLGEQLEEAVQQAETIICGSGYSTLMDAWYWKKDLLLVPTPGQGEQEYLARHWAQLGWAQWQEQRQLKVK